MNHSLGPPRKGGTEEEEEAFKGEAVHFFLASIAGGRWRGAQGIPDGLQPRGERRFGVAPPTPTPPAEGRPPDVFNEAPGLLRAALETPREVQSELRSADPERNQPDSEKVISSSSSSSIFMMNKRISLVISSLSIFCRR